eukprot:11208648-Lingulodinium_polyedra.AAC.1
MRLWEICPSGSLLSVYFPAAPCASVSHRKSCCSMSQFNASCCEGPSAKRSVRVVPSSTQQGWYATCVWRMRLQNKPKGALGSAFIACDVSAVTILHSPCKSDGPDNVTALRRKTVGVFASTPTHASRRGGHGRNT